MSRVGNTPIYIPSGVQVKLSGNQVVVSKGDVVEGCLLPESVEAVIHSDKLCFQGPCESSFLGLYRSIVNNVILGVDKKFQVTLEIKGVGYRADLSNSYLTLFLGFSHSIKYRVPSYIMVTLSKPTEVLMYGADKCKLNMVASDICSIKKYNPYKKKGISKKGQYVFVKEMNKK